MINMSVLIYPLATEKAVGVIERLNTITYIVDHRAKVSEIREEFEDKFGVNVDSIRVANMPNNKKKAYIRLSKGSSAADVAMKLKLV